MITEHGRRSWLGKNSTASDVMKIVERRREPRQSRLSASQGLKAARRLPWSYLETMRGAGAISTVLVTHGYKVVSTTSPAHPIASWLRVFPRRNQNLAGEHLGRVQG